MNTENEDTWTVVSTSLQSYGSQGGHMLWTLGALGGSHLITGPGENKQTKTPETGCLLTETQFTTKYETLHHNSYLFYFVYVH